MILFEVNVVRNPEIEAAKIFAGEKRPVISAPLPENGDIWQEEGERISFLKPERLDEEGLCGDLLSLEEIEEMNRRSCERFMDNLPYIKNEEGMAVFAVSGEKKAVPIEDFLAIYEANYKKEEVKEIKSDEENNKKEAGLAGLALGGGLLAGVFLILKNSIEKASRRERLGNRIDVRGGEFQNLLTERAKKEDRRIKMEMIEESLGIKKESKREEKIDYRMGRWSRDFSGGSERWQEVVMEKQIKQLKKQGYEVYDARDGGEEMVERAVKKISSRETGRGWDGRKVAVILDKNKMSDREKLGANYIVVKGDLYDVRAAIKGGKSVKDIDKLERMGPEGIEVKNWKGREKGVNVYEVGGRNRH